jgi:hypothetical protein
VSRFRSVLIVLGVLVAAVLSGPAVPAAAAVVTEGFETGFGDWNPDTDGLAPAWSVKRSTEQAHAGSYSLQVFMDGRQDDGTTWVERKFAVAPRTTVRVTVSFWLWSERQSDLNGWSVVASAGIKDPEIERDFTTIGFTEQTAGWASFSLTRSVTADASGTIWIAVGTSVLWETQRHHFIDDVSVEILAIGPQV